MTAYAVYLKKAVWPGALTVFYPPPVIVRGRVVAAIVVLLAVTVIVVWRARRQRYLFTGWFWFLGTLVPVIGIVKIGDFFIADRYMYMPLTGLLIMGVFSLKALVDRLSHRLTWLIVIPVLMAGVYAPAASRQIQTWRDSETLYRHALSVTGDNFLAHHALGHLLALRNDRAGAIDHFSKAASIRPDKAVLWVALGKALAFDQQWRQAEDEAFSRAAKLEPEHPAVWFYLGCARAARHDVRGSLVFLAKCLEKAEQRDAGIGFVYAKVMDFYENGLYYEAWGQWPLAGQYYMQALALTHMDGSRRQLTRQVVGGYDQWLAGLSGLKKGAD
jgi:tetratricopeptide (TPR) repeat protein